MDTLKFPTQNLDEDYENSPMALHMHNLRTLLNQGELELFKNDFYEIFDNYALNSEKISVSTFYSIFLECIMPRLGVKLYTENNLDNFIKLLEIYSPFIQESVSEFMKADLPKCSDFIRKKYYSAIIELIDREYRYLPKYIANILKYMPSDIIELNQLLDKKKAQFQPAQPVRRRHYSLVGLFKKLNVFSQSGDHSFPNNKK